MASSFDPFVARRHTGDDEQLLREVIALFLEDNPKQEAELRRALERRDAGLLERSAHTIKGSCVIFGAAEAQEAAHALEKLGREGNFEAAASALARLGEETGRLTADLKRYVEGAPS